jgi:uncharacterized protein DUF3455
MTNNYYRTVFVLPVTLSILFLSCTHDKVDKAVDTSTPAFHISESERATIPAAIALPDNLPAGNSRVATFYAVGVQKYKAQEVPNSNPVTYQWVFVAPQADLYDATNNKVGTHSAGPDWQLSAADTMFGQSFTPPRTAPSDDPNSIDWLLLMPKVGKAPTGFFANVSYVQRVVTNGGKAPTTAPVSADQTIDVPYTAVYRFSKQN